MVVEHVDFLASIGRSHQRLQVLQPIEILGIPLEAGRGSLRVARMIGNVEVDSQCGQGRLGLFQLQVVVEVAVIGAPGATENDMLLVAVEVIGNTEARLKLVLGCRAVVAVADVVVDVDATLSQCLGVGLSRVGCLGGRVWAVQRGEHVGGRDVVQVGRRALVVPSHADVQREFLGGQPVILNIEAELSVLRLRYWIQSRHGVRKLRLPGVRGRAGLVDAIEELRVDVLRIRCRERHSLDLDSRLDRMVAPPCQAGQCQIILHPGAALALVLSSPRWGRTDVDDRLIVVRLVGVDGPVAQAACSGRVIRILVDRPQLIEPAIRAAVPAGVDARVVIDHIDTGGVCRGNADILAGGFSAHLRAQFEAINACRLPIELAEVQILVEREICRAKLRRHARRQQGGDVGDGCARSDRDGGGEPLALIGHKEVRDVGNDGAAEGRAVFLVLRLGLLARRYLPRRLGAEVLARIRADDIAPELVGARLGLRRHGRAGDLVILRFVVGSDDLVLANGELRKGVALRSELSADPALLDVILLAHAIDVDVHGTRGLRAASQRRASLGIDAEHHAGNGVGKLEEVARELRNRFDLNLRDRRADFGCPDF